MHQVLKSVGSHRRLRLVADEARQAAKVAAEKSDREFQDRLTTASSDSRKVHSKTPGNCCTGLSCVLSQLDLIFVKTSPAKFGS